MLSKLSLFISSKMQELKNERIAIQSALADYDMHGWLWETDAGARPEPMRSTYLSMVEQCDIYIGIFGLGYGEYTIEEYDHARKYAKPCLIYEKRSDITKRDPRLQTFLDAIQQVTTTNGLTVAWFDTPEQLATSVKRDVMRLLTTRFRETHQQPIPHIIQEILGDDNEQIASKQIASHQTIKGNKNKQEIR